MRCPKCGTEATIRLAFCASCGERLPRPEEAPEAAVVPAPDATVAAAVPEPTGWRPVEPPARHFTLTMSVTCDHCAQPVPVNGPTRSVHCPNCDGDSRPPDLPEELVLAARGAMTIPSRYQHRSFKSPEPQCWKCGTGVPLGTFIEQCGETALFPCPQCGTGLPTYPAPAWLRAELPTARQVFGGDAETTQAEGGLPLEVDQQRAAPIVMTCPQCNGALTITADTPRTVTCSYCSTNVFLPDALWTRMHPAKVMRRWTVSYTGELKTRRDLEQEQRAEQQKREQSQRQAQQDLEDQAHQEQKGRKARAKELKRVLIFLACVVAWVAFLMVFGTIRQGCKGTDDPPATTGEEGQDADRGTLDGHDAHEEPQPETRH